eukprot:TRINITY_DN14135_c0_g2_i1.p1 TRINITY_DN14135_c0_g2~~TRINITY_DN14135_c0_g2_i1.p1  ORF type:complete len:115 (-),score=30.83 TRINITY_DN14135_c0_g2_i1:444-788(-)
MDRNQSHGTKKKPRSSGVARRMRFGKKAASKKPHANPNPDPDRTHKIQHLIASHGRSESYFDRAAQQNPQFEQIRSAVKHEYNVHRQESAEEAGGGSDKTSLLSDEEQSQEVRI